MRRTSAALAPLLLLVGACSGSSDDGPLSIAGDPGATCVSTATASSFTVGVESVANSGDSPVTVRDVRLVNPDGLQLIEASLLPLAVPDAAGGAATLAGFQVPYPPAGATAVAEWTERETAAGAEIPAGAGRAVVVGVTSAGGGSADALEIEYTDDEGSVYTVRTSWRIDAAPNCAS